MSDGYVDLQVNGYAGIDFNCDDLELPMLHEACVSLEKHGVSGILATLITAPPDSMVKRLKTIVAARENDDLVRNVILGVHLEGPFLNSGKGYIGAHNPNWAMDASMDLVDRLMGAGEGLIRLWTLAPERDEGSAVTRKLADQGVLVSAGHCGPSMDQLCGAIDAGLSMFTHLGNGCPAMMPRHDNIIQHVLSKSDRLHVSFIADGVHVPFPALGNYIRCVGMDRAVVVTDAISAAGLGPGQYSLGGRTVVVGDDYAGRYPEEEDHLAGSAITMKASDQNLADALGLNKEERMKLLCDNSMRLLGKG